jgi:hypothetical protein
LISAFLHRYSATRSMGQRYEKSSSNTASITLNNMAGTSQVSAMLAVPGFYIGRFYLFSIRWVK